MASCKYSDFEVQKDDLTNLNRIYDQALSIATHGVLTVTPSLCYHSVLSSTDKLFVLPLLKDGSLTFDTVIGASIIQPGEDNRAAKSEVKPVKTSPALWQSIHSIIHSRSQPVRKQQILLLQVLMNYCSFNRWLVRLGLLFLPHCP